MQLYCYTHYYDHMLIMSTSQVLRAAADIIEKLDSNYNQESILYKKGQSISDVYPDHLIKPLSNINHCALYRPESILYKVVFHDIYLLDVLDILQNYPLALEIMCNHTEDGKCTTDILKRHEYYEFIKCNYLG